MKVKNQTRDICLSVVGRAGATAFLPSLFIRCARLRRRPTCSSARRIGAIKSINGNTITLTPDSGPEVAVTVQPNARILRIAPGAKDLKNATPTPACRICRSETGFACAGRLPRRCLNRSSGGHRHGAIPTWRRATSRSNRIGRSGAWEAWSAAWIRRPGR